MPNEPRSARQPLPPDVDERLLRIQAVTDAALTHLDLDELLQALLDRITEALESDTCAFLLLDVPSNELIARAAKGIEEEVEQGVRIPVGMGFAGRIAADRRPVIIEDVDHADVLNPILRQKGIKSLLGVPLLVGSDVVGVLHVGSLTNRIFTRDDAELLQLAADRAAYAIEHSRMYEETRRTAHRLGRLQTITDAALSTLNLGELLEELVDRVRAALEVDTCAILLVDDERDQLVARAARGIEEEVEQGVRIPVGGGFAGRIAAEQRTIMLPDVDHAHVLNPILRQKGIKSLLGAPLVSRGRVLGVIHVGTLHPHMFDQEEVTLLELAAARAATGLERALVHEELIRLDQVRHSFITIASHELRTPAAAVVGAAITLKEQAERLSREDEWALKEMLAEQARRLARLIDQLLDVSRVENEALELAPRQMRLADHVQGLVAAVAGTVPVEVDIASDLELEADPIALDRVISNLIGNAVRYGDPPVVVSAVRGDRHVRLTVSDSGAGVPQDLEGRLFEQFARGSNSAGSQGAGLGLAIARSYARAHGGDLVYHGGEGGARFELILPVVQSAD
jgi:signal transduction histidine kinase